MDWVQLFFQIKSIDYIFGWIIILMLIVYDFIKYMAKKGD
jgi:hypothetical protein